MKKTFLLFVFLMLLMLAPHAFAETGFVPLAPITGLTDPGTASKISAGSFALFFNNLYKFLVGLAVALAIIEIIWGGLEYSTTDSIGSKESGKNRIKNALFGLLLILSPVIVFTIINPCILNLSVTFTPIGADPVEGSKCGQ